MQRLIKFKNNYIQKESMASKSAIASVSSRKFSDIIMQSSPNERILVDFYASWCGPCKKIAPRLEELAHRYSNVTFIKVNVEKYPDIAHTYQINSLPTFVLFNKGSLQPRAPPVMGASISKVEALLNSR